MRVIKRIIIHHSAAKNTENILEVDRFHRLTRKWDMIGYHYFIMYDVYISKWLLHQARPPEIAGAHDGGQNADSIGICIAGNYSIEKVPEQAMELLLDTVCALCKKFGLTQANAEGHRENEPSSTPTECPGKNFDIDKFRHDLANRLMWP